MCGVLFPQFVSMADTGCHEVPTQGQNGGAVARLEHCASVYAKQQGQWSQDDLTSLDFHGFCQVPWVKSWLKSIFLARSFGEQILSCETGCWWCGTLYVDCNPYLWMVTNPLLRGFMLWDGNYSCNSYIIMMYAYVCIEIPVDIPIIMVKCAYYNSPSTHSRSHSYDVSQQTLKAAQPPTTCVP